MDLWFLEIYRGLANLQWYDFRGRSISRSAFHRGSNNLQENEWALRWLADYRLIYYWCERQLVQNYDLCADFWWSCQSKGSSWPPMHVSSHDCNQNFQCLLAWCHLKHNHIWLWEWELMLYRSCATKEYMLNIWESKLS